MLKQQESSWRNRVTERVLKQELHTNKCVGATSVSVNNVANATNTSISAKESEDEIQAIKTPNSVVFCSGLFAGVLSRSLTAPADRMKLVFQAQSLEHRQMSVKKLARTLLHEGGITSFWRGNFTNCLKMGPEVALRFLIFENIQLRVSQNPARPRFHERLFAGANAGVLAQAMIYPLEVAKARLALSTTGAYRGIFDCLLKTVEQNGLRGLYAGWQASALGMIPYCATDLSIFFSLKDFWCRKHNQESLSIGRLASFGACSSVIAQLVSYPLQVVRTRLMAQGMDTRYQTQFRSPYHTLLVTWRDGGLRGLYRGLLMNFSKSVPAITITYVTFEKMKELFLNARDQ